jgi:hypothetical protein
MTWLRVFIHRLRGLFLKRKLEQELQEEIRSHLDMQIEDNLRQGMSLEEARYEALRKFGGVEQVKESYRDRRSLAVVDSAAASSMFSGSIWALRPKTVWRCRSIWRYKGMTKPGPGNLPPARD